MAHPSNFREGSGRSYKPAQGYGEPQMYENNDEKNYGQSSFGNQNIPEHNFHQSAVTQGVVGQNHGHSTFVTEDSPQQIYIQPSLSPETPFSQDINKHVNEQEQVFINTEAPRSVIVPSRKYLPPSRPFYVKEQGNNNLVQEQGPFSSGSSSGISHQSSGSLIIGENPKAIQRPVSSQAMPQANSDSGNLHVFQPFSGSYVEKKNPEDSQSHLSKPLIRDFQQNYDSTPKQELNYVPPQNPNFLQQSHDPKSKVLTPERTYVPPAMTSVTEQNFITTVSSDLGFHPPPLGTTAHGPVISNTAQEKIKNGQDDIKFSVKVYSSPETINQREETVQNFGLFSENNVQSHNIPTSISPVLGSHNSHASPAQTPSLPASSDVPRQLYNPPVETEQIGQSLFTDKTRGQNLVPDKPHTLQNIPENFHGPPKGTIAPNQGYGEEKSGPSLINNQVFFPSLNFHEVKPQEGSVKDYNPPSNSHVQSQSFSPISIPQNLGQTSGSSSTSHIPDQSNGRPKQYYDTPLISNIPDQNYGPPEQSFSPPSSSHIFDQTHGPPGQSYSPDQNFNPPEQNYGPPPASAIPEQTYPLTEQIVAPLSTSIAPEQYYGPPEQSYVPPAPVPKIPEMRYRPLEQNDVPATISRAPEQGYRQPLPSKIPEVSYGPSKQSFGPPSVSVDPDQNYGPPEQKYSPPSVSQIPENTYVPPSASNAPEQSYVPLEQTHAHQSIFSAPEQTYSPAESNHNLPSTFNVPQQTYGPLSISISEQNYAPPSDSKNTAEQNHGSPSISDIPHQSYGPADESYGPPSIPNISEQSYSPPKETYSLPSSSKAPDQSHSSGQTYSPQQESYGSHKQNHRPQLISEVLGQSYGPAEQSYDLPPGSHISDQVHGPPTSSQVPKQDFGRPTSSQVGDQGRKPIVITQIPEQNYGLPSSSPKIDQSYGLPSNMKIPSQNYGLPSDSQILNQNYGPDSSSQVSGQNFDPPSRSQNYGPPSNVQIPNQSYGQPSDTQVLGQSHDLPGDSQVPDQSFDSPSDSPNYGLLSNTDIPDRSHGLPLSAQAPDQYYGQPISQDEDQNYESPSNSQVPGPIFDPPSNSQSYGPINSQIPGQGYGPPISSKAQSQKSTPSSSNSVPPPSARKPSRKPMPPVVGGPHSFFVAAKHNYDLVHEQKRPAEVEGERGRGPKDYAQEASVHPSVGSSSQAFDSKEGADYTVPSLSLEDSVSDFVVKSENHETASNYDTSPHVTGSVYGSPSPTDINDGPIFGEEGPESMDPDGDCVRGEAFKDYPAFTSVPDTSFECQDRVPGFYADGEDRVPGVWAVFEICSVWHYCLPDGRQESFLCPIGTLFNQRHFICDWWYNTNCTASQELYHLNDILYERYTESRTSKAPEDSRTEEDFPSADGSLSSSSTSERSYKGQGLQEAFGERERGEGSPQGIYGLPEESPEESYGLREENPKESYDHPRELQEFSQNFKYSHRTSGIPQNFRKYDRTSTMSTEL
ncbi:nascent polypeptide-associated complex subunit alpha, muscle-specific form-like [Penaeus chinensis]|uniref:nascent polypeptide-associated complex subunit alpha, muscle-specific form-like n=1 Tax=Penaeus chinensis TaxID=139456 RepID=UPI001FB79FD1|nr:nascent polypeptide-associated complex subunit alpha, muscle-specific form-like [Penaeus chinensis]